MVRWWKRISLLQKLNFKGTKTKLSVTTLQGENEPIECSIVSLEAFDLSKNNIVQLPKVYSRPSLPIPPVHHGLSFLSCKNFALKRTAEDNKEDFDP